MALPNKVLPGFSASLWCQTNANPTALSVSNLAVWSGEVADIVGSEMLIQYLREIIGTMRLAVIQLERGQMYDFDIKNFIDELDRVESFVSRYEGRNYKRLEAENQLLLKIETLEQKIASQLILF